MRKAYLDNLRWGVIILVVIFHVFFYFNNVGVKPLFNLLPEYTEGGSLVASAVYQYAVYPWFMLILFVIAGISSRYALTRRSPKEYARERTRKLLVPSTLGVLCFGWISGHIIVSGMGGEEMPKPVFWMVSTFSGTGALWFLQVLFICSMFLLLIRFIDKRTSKDGTEHLPGEWEMPSWVTFLILLLLYFPLWGAANILNVPMITSYRIGIYLLAFLLGYYFFSRENVLKTCEEYRFIFLAIALISGAFFIYKSYGTYYADAGLLKTWHYNLFGYFMTPALLGLGRKYFDKSSAVTDYFKKTAWGVYILHIPVIVLTGNLLVTSTHLPLWSIYILLAIAAFCISTLLYEIFRRIPLIRYLMFGMAQR